MNRRTNHRAVSLFSNCGAGDVGYRNSGFEFDVMAELEQHRLDVCLLNHSKANGIAGDLRSTWRQVVEKYRAVAGNNSPSLVAACPPCQGMSTAKSDRGLENDPDAGNRDSRNLLVVVISNVVNELAPKIVVVENVQAFLTRKIRHPESKKAISAARFLIDELSQKYAVYPVAVDLCDFGVPQRRKRSFLTFVRKDIAAYQYLETNKLTPYPLPLHAADYGGEPVTLHDALESFDLPQLDAGDEESARSNYAGGLHSVPVWKDRRYSFVAAIPSGSGKSAWENDCCGECGKVRVDENAALCPKCGEPLLRPVVKARNGRYRLIHGFRTSTYRRMRADAPSATITTASGRVGSNNTIHPYQNRLLSPMECALLQTFPTDFKWGKALLASGHSHIREMIGEAVPPLFTALHGDILSALLRGDSPRNLLPAEDVRCTSAQKKLGLFEKQLV